MINSYYSVLLLNEWTLLPQHEPSNSLPCVSRWQNWFDTKPFHTYLHKPVYMYAHIHIFCNRELIFSISKLEGHIHCKENGPVVNIFSYNSYICLHRKGNFAMSTKLPSLASPKVVGCKPVMRMSWQCNFRFNASLYSWYYDTEFPTLMVYETLICIAL